jgi:hypothetical protein
MNIICGQNALFLYIFGNLIKIKRNGHEVKVKRSSLTKCAFFGSLSKSRIAQIINAALSFANGGEGNNHEYICLDIYSQGFNYT